MRKLGLLVLLAVFLLNFQGCKGTNANGVEGANNGEKVGLKLPENAMKAEFTKLDGSKTKIENYKGKVLLVNIWGTWCGPCRAEIPELIKLKDELKDKDFEIVGLNTAQGLGAEPESVVKSYIEQAKINYEIGYATEVIQMEMSKLSERSSVPMTFVFNKKGDVVGIFTGFNPNTTPPKLKTTIEKALSQEG